MNFIAVIFTYNDHKKLDLVIKQLKHFHPDVKVICFNNGGDDPSNVLNKYSNIKIYNIPNCWAKVPPTYTYDYFTHMYNIGLNMEENFLLYLETDVIITDKIIDKDLPLEYDIIGDWGGCAPWSEIVYDELKLRNVGYLPNQHSGCGGTFFSKNFFLKTVDHLPRIKELYRKHLFSCYQDLIMTLLGRIADCNLYKSDIIRNVNEWDVVYKENDIFLSNDKTLKILHGLKL